mgnify:CR=1 FL=1
METFLGILIPFLGTSLGAGCVLFMNKTLDDKVRRALTGFAAGVMVAASVWSLIIPAIVSSRRNRFLGGRAVFAYSRPRYTAFTRAKRTVGRT